MEEWGGNVRRATPCLYVICWSCPAEARTRLAGHLWRCEEKPGDRSVSNRVYECRSTPLFWAGLGRTFLTGLGEVFRFAGDDVGQDFGRLLAGQQ